MSPAVSKSLPSASGVVRNKTTNTTHMNTLLAFTDSELRDFLDVALLPVLLVILVLLFAKAVSK